MAYVKPGVEIVQESKTTTPALITPDLEGCLVGNGYYWQDISLEESIVTWKTHHGGTPTTVALSGINSVYYDVEGLKEMVLVDLVAISGTGIGEVSHLTYTTDFSVTSNIVTISGAVGTSENLFQIRVGYLANKNASDYGMKILYSLADVAETIGEPVSWNPLAFGARLAMLNSGRQLTVLNVSGVTSDAIETAIDGELGTRDVYAIAPMTYNVGIGTLKTHVVNASLPENKKERIAIVNRDASAMWTSTPFASDNTSKTNTVEAIRDANISYLERRLTITSPDIAYITETRHISTISPAWIKASFLPYGAVWAGAYTNYLKAKFAFDAFVNNKKYKANTEITTAIWTELRDYGWASGDGLVTVLVPVPGFYYTALVVGQVIGEFPEQPLTNLPTNGLKETKGSSDYYNEAQLNILAEGGTYIMVQPNPNAPIVSRHQLTTDMTQVSKRELSIVKALDYVAKFIRKSLSPYIGRYTITPAFLKLINSILISISLYLTREGRIADMKILSVSVDENSPDTIRITVDIKVKYPVNYIKVTLLF